MNVNIICTGKLKEKYLKDAEAEYSKRLSRFCKLTIKEFPDIQMSENHSIKERDAVLLKEAEKILASLGANDFVVALCVEGKQKTSEKFAEFFSQTTLSGKSSFTFIIGSSEGLSPVVKKRADLLLSFSEMTFPHQLMRIILLEQIYRAFKINANESYHK